MNYQTFISNLSKQCSTKLRMDYKNWFRNFTKCTQKPTGSFYISYSSFCDKSVNYFRSFKSYRQYQTKRSNTGSRNPFNFYKSYTWQRLYISLLKSMKIPKSNRVYLFASTIGTFSWEKDGISDDEIKSYAHEIDLLSPIKEDKSSLLSLKDSRIPKEWENILNTPTIKIWKVYEKKTDSYIYKVLGRNVEICAKDFFTVQTDLNYRKVWDKLVIEIDVVDQNKETKEEVLRWITAYPYPLKPREYVYVRRSKVLDGGKILAVMSRSVEHPSCKEETKYVRVPTYISHIFIKPHTKADNPGMDFLLTYSDEPKTALPNRLTSWITSTGIPEYLDKVYKACENISKHLQEIIQTTPVFSNCENATSQSQESN